MAKVWPPQGTDSPSFAFKATCCCEVKGPAEAVLEYQQIGALTGPCGFTGNSGSTRFFRTKTWSGTLHAEYFDSCSEGAMFLDEADDAYGGSLVVTLTVIDTGFGHEISCVCSGAVTVNGDVYMDGDSCSDNPLPIISTCPPPELATSGDDFTQYVGGDCTVVGGGTGCVTTGSAREQWTDETFFQDNIDIADSQPWDEGDAFWLPDSGIFFGIIYADWLNTGWTGGLGNAYTRGRFRYRQNHLIPGHEYTFSVEVWRATKVNISDPIFEADYSLFATIEVVVTADGTGVVHIDPTDVPNAAGFITIIKTSTLTLTPS